VSDLVQNSGTIKRMIQSNIPLAPLTWFGTGGTAEFYAKPSSIQEVHELLSFAQRHGLVVRILGGGSNLLVSDCGVRGLIVDLRHLDMIRQSHSKLSVGAGCITGKVVAYAYRAGLTGLECFTGIPGTIGGAVVGNAGGSDGQVGTFVESVFVIEDKQIQRLERTELAFGYRSSNLRDRIVVSVELRLLEGRKSDIRNRMNEVRVGKHRTQPTGRGNAGCVFKNSNGVSAGKLIEQAGLKGTKVGGAMISRRHANFIVVDPLATSSDICELIRQVQSKVLDTCGVELELEIIVW
jgi:UDP-N-acetylmuramate dehydrogenase